MKQLFKLINIMFSRFTITQSLNIHQHIYCLLYLQGKYTCIYWLFVLFFIHRHLPLFVLLVLSVLDLVFLEITLLLLLEITLTLHFFILLPILLKITFFLSLPFFLIAIYLEIFILLLLFKICIITLIIFLTTKLLRSLFLPLHNLLFVIVTQSCEIIVFGDNLEQISGFRFATIDLKLLRFFR